MTGAGRGTRAAASPGQGPAPSDKVADHHARLGPRAAGAFPAGGRLRARSAAASRVRAEQRVDCAPPPPFARSRRHTARRDRSKRSRQAPKRRPPSFRPFPGLIPRWPAGDPPRPAQADDHAILKTAAAANAPGRGSSAAYAGRSSSIRRTTCCMPLSNRASVLSAPTVSKCEIRRSPSQRCSA